jgi:hypothetical protein
MGLWTSGILQVFEEQERGAMGYGRREWNVSRRMENGIRSHSVIEYILIIYKNLIRFASTVTQHYYRICHGVAASTAESFSITSPDNHWYGGVVSWRWTSYRLVIFIIQNLIGLQPRIVRPTTTGLPEDLEIWSYGEEERSWFRDVLNATSKLSLLVSKNRKISIVGSHHDIADWWMRHLICGEECRCSKECGVTGYSGDIGPGTGRFNVCSWYYEYIECNIRKETSKAATKAWTIGKSGEKVECFQLWDGWGGYDPPFVNARTFRICQPARQAFLGALPMFYR